MRTRPAAICKDRDGKSDNEDEPEKERAKPKGFDQDFNSRV